MRVLHLFSNSKWTGPAEPALNLCVALRSLGVEADFASAPDAGRSVNKVVTTARDRGIEPVLRFRLDKHHHPVHNWLDARRLDRWLRRRPYDLLHCHLDNDHRIARAPALRHNVPLVRSSYEGEGFAPKRDRARLLGDVDHLIEPSERARAHDIAAYGLEDRGVTVIPNAVDTARFDPARDVPDGRRWLNLPPDAFVVGIVARMQTHRRYEDFLAGIREVIRESERVQVIVVGRGTNQDNVAMEPVRRMGLEGRVHFAGFVEGENYVGMLKAFDVKVFLVPGSDGTCRAVREAMAMGKPAVVADRGMLGEIVDDGESGFVTDGSPRGLFEALTRLLFDRQRLYEMGQAARAKATKEFALSVQAERVLAVYERVLAARGG